MTPLEVYTSPGPVRFTLAAAGVDIWHLCVSCLPSVPSRYFVLYEAGPITHNNHAALCSQCEGPLFPQPISTTESP